LADFVASLEPVNALADDSPGFVWRLQTDDGDATAIRAFDDERILVNASVWESMESLWRFVYDGRHLEVMRRRREWFTRLAEAHLGLWWIPAGSIPTLADMRERIEHLRAHGPTPYAFTFKRHFPPPSVGEQREIVDERDPCPA
jgi:hypothetical protein